MGLCIKHCRTLDLVKPGANQQFAGVRLFMKFSLRLCKLAIFVNDRDLFVSAACRWSQSVRLQRGSERDHPTDRAATTPTGGVQQVLTRWRHHRGCGLRLRQGEPRSRSYSNSYSLKSYFRWNQITAHRSTTSEVLFCSQCNWVIQWSWFSLFLQ